MNLKALNHTFEGYDSEQRVARLESLLTTELYPGDRMTGKLNATSISNIQKSSGHTKKLFGVCSTFALAAALAAPGTLSQVVTVPVAAALMLAARDQHRAQRAASQVMQTPAYKHAAQPA